ncbi:Sorting nexin, cytoplasm-to-vacuole targeting pathway/endosomal sorting [Gryganskiella cystojenkinii]|nr:Sorting nexin, cytoplasm-to-vacuole targeting pathway/endosomal sorting [Gryganskiella cystojenkinii]
MSFSDSEDHRPEQQRPHTPPPAEPYTAFTTIPRAAPGTTCCSVSTLLHQPHITLFVTSATKQADGLTASAFVAYTIKIGDNEVKRRYSEFESLRKVLCRIYPTLIVPPIPEKHSISNYANIQNKSKEDAAMVEKRKRMLQKFLNRLAKHEILSYEHVFHRFLEAGVSWSELMHCPPISTLPKNPLNATLTASSSSASLARSPSMPASPSASSQSSPGPATPAGAVAPPPLRQPDPRFIDSEVFTQKFANQLSGSMDRSQKKVVRKLGEIANDNSDLGATLNGFSLSESESIPLANAIEKIGQAVDSSFMATTALMQALEVNVNEPMQEYVQYANIIKSILKFRHQKHIQSESTADQLETKRSSLENLEKMETEAKRIEDALKRERSTTGGSTGTPTTATPQRSDASDDTTGGDNQSITEEGTFTNEPESNGDAESEQTPYNPYARPTPPSSGSNAAVADSTNPYAQLPPSNNPYANTHTTPTAKRRSTRLNVFSALSHTLHGIIDVDPEATRRNNIGKTRDAIVQLEEQLETTNADLEKISRAVQTDLDRFQRQKIKDLRDVLLAYAKAHQKWCQKNYNNRTHHHHRNRNHRLFYFNNNNTTMLKRAHRELARNAIYTEVMPAGDQADEDMEALAQFSDSGSDSDSSSDEDEGDLDSEEDAELENYIKKYEGSIKKDGEVEDEEAGSDDEEKDSDDEEAGEEEPEAEESTHYRCKICPRKTLKNETMVQVHLDGRDHKANLKLYKRALKAERSKEHIEGLKLKGQKKKERYAKKKDERMAAKKLKLKEKKKRQWERKMAAAAAADGTTGDKVEKIAEKAEKKVEEAVHKVEKAVEKKVAKIVKEAEKKVEKEVNKIEKEANKKMEKVVEKAVAKESTTSAKAKKSKPPAKKQKTVKA